MTKIVLASGAVFAAVPALADTGLHHHPHGIEGAWVLLILAGALAGWAAARFWGRK